MMKQQPNNDSIAYVEVRMHSPTLEFREEGLLSM
jgi:hypothetical protein